MKPQCRILDCQCTSGKEGTESRVTKNIPNNLEVSILSLLSLSLTASHISTSTSVILPKMSKMLSLYVCFACISRREHDTVITADGIHVCSNYRRVPSDGVVFPPNEEKASSVSLSLNLVNYNSLLGPSQLELLI